MAIGLDYKRYSARANVEVTASDKVSFGVNIAPSYTISSMLANQFGEADGSQVSSLMYAALILMILTLMVNVFAQWIVKKLSLKYK